LNLREEAAIRGKACKNGRNPCLKRAKSSTILGFPIDKRGPKPHRKRRWVRFTRINTGFPDDAERALSTRVRLEGPARHGF
jgi:hypothetical protein